MRSYTFIVEGQPIGKERARVTKRGHAYTPPRTVEYERRVQLLGASARPSGWPLDAEYVLTVRLFMGDKRRRDIDNCAKAVGDALNKTAYADDSQVRELHAYRTFDKLQPRAEVTITVCE